MGIIRLNQMEFYAYHGCYHEEQLIGNRFIVDLQMHVDSTKAAISDNIEDTVSYLEVFQLVKEQMATTSKLLEHVAGRILDAIFLRFPEVERSIITIHKLAPPLGGQLYSASLTLER